MQVLCKGDRGVRFEKKPTLLVFLPTLLSVDRFAGELAANAVARPGEADRLVADHSEQRDEDDRECGECR